MGKHTLDNVLSIGGDILAPFTGGLSAAIGNGLAGADRLAHGDILGAVLDAVGGTAGSAIGNTAASFVPGAIKDVAGGITGGFAGAAGDALTSVTGNSIAGDVLQAALPGAIATGVKDYAGEQVGEKLPSAIGSLLGLSGGNTAAGAPVTNAAPKGTPTGGAGPGGGAPGNTNVSGSTAPNVFPWSTATLAKGGGAPAPSGGGANRGGFMAGPGSTLTQFQPGTPGGLG